MNKFEGLFRNHKNKKKMPKKGIILDEALIIGVRYKTEKGRKKIQRFWDGRIIDPKYFKPLRGGGRLTQFNIWMLQEVLKLAQTDSAIVELEVKKRMLIRIDTENLRFYIAPRLPFWKGLNKERWHK